MVKSFDGTFVGGKIHFIPVACDYGSFTCPCDRLGGGAKQSVRVCLGCIIPVLVEIYVWSEPLVVLIPLYGLGDAAVKVVLRCKSQFVTCGRDVASPVALFHDVVLVVVEG